MVSEWTTSPLGYQHRRTTHHAMVLRLDQARPDGYPGAEYAARRLQEHAGG